jgi:hypothetical protein
VLGLPSVADDILIVSTDPPWPKITPEPRPSTIDDNACLAYPLRRSVFTGPLATPSQTDARRCLPCLLRGPDAAKGGPFKSPGEMCHRWHPQRLDTVTVCEVGKAIRSVGYVSLSSTTVTLAAPDHAVITFPADLPTQARTLAEALGDEPFSSTYVMGDGEGIFGMDWFLPQEAEGTPNTHLSVVARDADFGKERMRLCAPGRTA